MTPADGADSRRRLINIRITRNGGNVTRPRAADDFPMIRARMEELRRERARVLRSKPCRYRQSRDPGRGTERPLDVSTAHYSKKSSRSPRQFAYAAKHVGEIDHSRRASSPAQ